MATLRQSLRGLPRADTQTMRGPGGVLQQKKTLQEATQQAGLPAAPTTPMGAQMLGATPKAADMTGTPQQLKSALQQSVAPQQPADLQTALRQKQYQRAVTTEEMEKLSKSASMQALGGLGDRVTNMVNQEKKKGDAVAKIDVPIVATYDGKSTEPIKETLKQLRASPNDMTLQQAVANYFGRVLTSDEINALFVPQAEAVAGGAAAAIGPTTPGAPVFTLANMVQDPEFGYTLPQLSQLLQVPEATLANYTVEDLQAKINQVQAQEFEQSKQLQATAVSPLAGAAERQLAQEASRELSSIGIAVTESDVQNLVNDIASANMVTFNGKQMTYEQALSDENISQFVKAYLEAPANSKTKADMKAAEPTLTAFADKHAGILTTAAANLGAGATQFKTIQDFNTGVLNKSGLSKTTLEKLLPGVVGFLDKQIDIEKIPTLKYLNNLPDADRSLASNEINQAVANGLITPAEFNALTVDELNKLGIGKPKSNWAQWKAYNDKIKEIADIDDTDYNTLMQSAFSDVSDINTAQSYIQKGNALRTLGLDPGVKLTSLDPSKLKSTIMDANKSISLTDAAKMAKIPAWSKQPLGTPNVPAGVQGDILAKLQPLLEDGSLTAEEMDAPGSAVQSLNIDELVALEDLSRNGKSKIDQGTVSRLRSLTADRNTRDTFNSLRGGRSALDTAVEIANTDPSGRKINKNILAYNVEQELLDAAESAAAQVQSVGSIENVNKMFRPYVNSTLAKLDLAVRTGIASPRITKAYYAIRGPVSFSM